MAQNSTTINPQLQAYFDSSAMNVASIGTGMSLILGNYRGIDLLTGLAMFGFLFFMAGYSAWFWWRKPKKVKTSKLLSGLGFYFFVYWFAQPHLPIPLEWSTAIGLAAGMVILLIYAVRGNDKD